MAISNETKENFTILCLESWKNTENTNKHNSFIRVFPSTRFDTVPLQSLIVTAQFISSVPRGDRKGLIL